MFSTYACRLYLGSDTYLGAAKYRSFDRILLWLSLVGGTARRSVLHFGDKAVVEVHHLMDCGNVNGDEDASVLTVINPTPY